MLYSVVQILSAELEITFVQICTLSDNIIFTVVFFICKNNNHNYYGCLVSLNISQYYITQHYMMDFVEIWYGKP